MIIPDVNLLLYAVISGFDHHRRAKSWWEEAVNGSERIGLAPPALFGFLRISTSARVLSAPLTVPAATGYIRGWVAQPTVEVLRSGARHLAVALELIESAGTARNLTTDAQIAAHAVERNGRVCSNDSDFARFPGVEWINPLA